MRSLLGYEKCYAFLTKLKNRKRLKLKIAQSNWLFHRYIEIVCLKKYIS